MKILKTILLIIAGGVALAMIFALFLPKNYTSEREITINQTPDSVFNYLRYLKNQDHFSPWSKLDPNMKKNYSGTDGQVGAKFAWSSEMKEAGKGDQMIINLVEGARIDLKLHFVEPFESNDNVYFLTEDAGMGQTKVKWGFYGKMSYPMNLMLVCMDMDQMLGSQLQTGLDNLKNILEK